MVKKLLDLVPDRQYSIVVGMEQFYDTDQMPFEQTLEWLKEFEERSRRHA